MSELPVLPPAEPQTPSGPATDANVESLLSKAYVPVVPDARFAAEAERRMLGLRRGPATRPLSSVRAWTIGLAASIVLLSAYLLLGDVLLARLLGPALPGVRRDGEVVWVDGVAYRRDGAPGSPWSRVGPGGVAFDEPMGVAGLVARTLGAVPPLERLAAGAESTTAPGTKRLVELPDGTRVALDGATKVVLREDRRLELISGRIFVEVASRAPSGAAERFVVTTPDRRVTALGTKFEVATAQGASRVLVTQGAVEVAASDASAAAVRVLAGQQLLPAAERGALGAVSAAPRATHALDWTYELVAASESPCVPRGTNAGGALICVDPWGNSAKLALRRYHVDVHVEDGWARTTIDQTYFNHDNRRLEGTFYFPLPADASLSRLAMYVDGHLMEGGMAERERAREVFEQIISAQRDPALLEWVDGSTFKMRVFPLEPREEKRILISYAQKLDSSYGRARYRFPAGHDLGLVRDWSCEMRLVGAAGGTARWTSPSHTLAESTDGADTVLRATAEHATFDKDLVVDVSPTTPVAAGARWGVFEHEGARYLSLRWRPELAAADGARARRDWVFLVETSGERDPVLARAQVEIVRALLEHGEHADTFDIVTAGTRTRRFADGPQAATPEAIARGIAFLESAHLVGALDLGSALAEARAMSARPTGAAAWNPVVVHVGSGVASLGERRPDELAKLAGDAPYVGLGIGKRWSRQLMKAAAARTGGLFAQINPDEVVSWRARTALAALDAPRLLDVRVVDAGEHASFLAGEDALAQGEELFAVAQLASGVAVPRTVLVSGRIGAETKTWTLEVGRPEAGGSYLPRAWARLEIERLLAADAAGNQARVVELSKQMYVMSPFTSLLVLENEKMYEEFKVDRGRKDHWALYRAPDQVPVVFEPDPRYPIEQFRRGRDLPTPKPETRTATADEVLASIMVRLAPRPVYESHRPYYGGNAYTAQQLLAGEVDDRFGWWGRYYDPSGRVGMERWAENQGLVGGKTTRDAKLGLVGAAKAVDRLERRLGAPASGPRQLKLLEQRQAGGKRDMGDRASSADEALAEGLAAPAPSRSNGRWGGNFKQKEGRKDVRRLESSLRSKQEAKKRAADDREESGAADADELVERIFQWGGRRGYELLHQPPQWNQDWRCFGDLLHQAEQLNTTRADIDAVLELEVAAGVESEPGRVDPAARELVLRARAIGARTARVQPEGEPAFEIRFDGRGRYAYERVLPSGLVERGWCDGARILHAYPEIGLGARRTDAAAHRSALEAWLPVLVAPVEELARGYDLRMVAGDVRAFALVPRGLAAREDGSIAAHAELELVFGEDGGLAERRLVERPSGKLLGRETYAADGRTRRFDERGAETGTSSLELRPAALDDAALTPDVSSLVVLPMPFRTRGHVWTTRQIKDQHYADWSDEQAMEVVAAALTQHPWEVQQVAVQRYLARGDERLGWYVLMLASGQHWDSAAAVDGKSGAKVGPTTAQAERSPLARFVADVLRIQRQGYGQEVAVVTDPAYPLLGRLSRLYAGASDLYSGRVQSRSPEDRARLQRELLEAARGAADADLMLGLLSLMQQRLPSDAAMVAPRRALLEELAVAQPELADVARYESARLLLRSGEKDAARAAFLALHAAQLARQGGLPRIDHDFYEALSTDADGGGFERWVRELADGFLSNDRVGLVVDLAWQCQMLGSLPLLSGELLGRALAAVAGKADLAVAFAAIEMLASTGAHGRADALVTGLLRDPALAKRADLWRLSAAFADQRGDTGRGLMCRERAIAIEMSALPEVVNLQAVREEMSGLLVAYRGLAGAVIAIGGKLPEGFVGRVVRAADQWRAVDPDDTAACQAAARILDAVGAHALAWDYLTTPLAEQPNEAAPWMALGAQLAHDGQTELARRAYRTAGEIEPGNPQPAWSEAQLLLQSARLDEAKVLLERLAAREWPRPNTWIGVQAKRYLEQGSKK